MAILANINSLNASLSQTSGYTNSQKNKKEFTKAFKGHIIESDSLASIIIIGCKSECIENGTLKLIHENEDNSYYQIEDSDIMLMGVEEKYKMLPLSCAIELQKYKFNYDGKNGYFSTKCEGVTTCVEKIAAADYLKVSVEAIREYELHHKSLKCINLPEMVALLTKNEHDVGHKIVGKYARNQWVYIDSVKQFMQFLKIIEQQRNLLAEKDFGLEF